MGSGRETKATGREFVERFLGPSPDGGSFEEGAFADAVDLLTDEGREAVVEAFPEGFGEGEMDTEDVLEAYRWGLYGQYGEPEGVGEVRVDEDGDGRDDEAGAETATVAVTAEFANGMETARLVVAEGGVAGFAFDPEYEVPAYVDRETFEEREVTVDAGDVDLGGVLTVPDGDGPFPAVLLVHGAGIHDPDGTAGASKILKDFAWGLATEGVASLRYEKRLAGHEEEVDDAEFTLDRVVVDDAVAALDALAAGEAVDGERLFVAGHSQGGMAAPRIAARHGGVAGVAVLDGPADPVLDTDHVGVIRYEFEIDGDLDADQETQLDDYRETARRIAEGDFEDDETLWGRPGTWYRSVADYDPTGTASDLDAPAFVAKTGRADPEIQPELIEFFRDGVEKWRSAALADGSRVGFYDGVDHYFQTGPTPTTMTALHFGGSVADHVVADLAAWIHETGAGKRDRETGAGERDREA